MWKLLISCLLIFTFANTANAAESFGGSFVDFGGQGTTGGGAAIDGNAPEDPHESCTPSQLAYDVSFIYVCTDQDNWVRAPLGTWISTECNAVLTESNGYMLMENGTKVGVEVQNACVCEVVDLITDLGNSVITNAGNTVRFNQCGEGTTCNIVVTSVGNTVISPIGNQLITATCGAVIETVCNRLLTNAGNDVYTSAGNRVITDYCREYDNVITQDGDNVISDGDQVVAP